MSSDDSDKTVFRQSGHGDHTVIRPTPGGKRRGASQQSSAYTTQTAVPLGNNLNAPDFLLQSAYVQTVSSLNPLIASASVLLTVFEKTRISPSHPNVDGLYQRLVAEIKTFEARIREHNIKPEIALTARYLLCTVLDEAVLNTPWGSESRWPQQTLLSTFHGETAGGEKFFLILERVKTSPRENLNLLELIYLCVSLGFEGKYKLAHRGREALEQIRDDLFAVIRASRGVHELSLSPSWRGLGKVQNSLASHIPLWVIVVSMLVILLLIYSGFTYGLYYSSAPAIEQLMDIANSRNMAKQ
ncbi:MAG: type IVB secretion system protein IcmH/DotU [Pseudomonadota bacterium]|nr:type IVB secretion system protein IcmH/DotU [Pseudomonadota bacterium]